LINHNSLTELKKRQMRVGSIFMVALKLKTVQYSEFIACKVRYLDGNSSGSVNYSLQFGVHS